MLATLLLPVLLIAVFGWNWMRGPMERMALHKTGRQLAINGDLTMQFAWPVARIHALKVTFANPSWAQEKQMLAAERVEIALDLPQLVRGNVLLPEVRLDQAVVFLEQGTQGRKSWLFDLQQQDEDARIDIGRVALDRAMVGYDDTSQNTRLRAELTTLPPADAVNKNAALRFSVRGHYKGLAVTAQGHGGPILALRDNTQPYPLTVNATIGRTRVDLAGTITSLLLFSAADLQIKLRGDSLEQLYPLLGMAAPATHAYVIDGHLLHANKLWKLEGISGYIGSSDIAGYARVVTGGKRPALEAVLDSNRLTLDDLGPVIGARPARAAANATVPVATARVLPDLPFNTERWNSVDADVQLRAKSLLRAKALPLEDLVAHLSLHDSILKIDSLDMGLAGGHLTVEATLDGRGNPIAAHAVVRVRKVLLNKLLPTVDLSKSSVGKINGDANLTGRGNSLASMLAGSNGQMSVIMENGQISKLLMEKVGMHVWEIAILRLTGDRLVKLNCAVADFDVVQGKMLARALVLDTQVTTIMGTGSIDLAHEQLNLLLDARTKNTSPLALRSPIYIHGTFNQPTVEVDKARIAARAAGAVALGILNPLLAWAPLIDLGPGQDRDCRRLVREAKSP